jgi:hypothetical protein
MKFVKIGSNILNLEQIERVVTFDQNDPSWISVYMRSGEKFDLPGVQGDALVASLSASKIHLPEEAVEK